MQIQQDNHGILGTNHQRRMTIDGPSQTKRNQQMAGTNYSQTSQSLPRIWKFLLMLYMKILRTSSSTKQFAKERDAIRLDTSMPGIIQHFEEEIYRRTGSYNARLLLNLQIELDAYFDASGAVLTQMDSNGDRHSVVFTYVKNIQ